jgi:hypothetical protein
MKPLIVRVSHWAHWAQVTHSVSLSRKVLITLAICHHLILTTIWSLAMMLLSPIPSPTTKNQRQSPIANPKPKHQRSKPKTKNQNPRPRPRPKTKNQKLRPRPIKKARKHFVRQFVRLPKTNLRTHLQVFFKHERFQCLLLSEAFHKQTAS